MKHAIARPLVLLLACAWIGPASAESSHLPRVICAGGALTEIVYALGAEDHLVGVDSTSTWPAATGKLPKIGYFRQLSTEGALSLRPTLVLATADAGPAETLAQLRSAGVRIETLANLYSDTGVVEKIHNVAHALGMPERGTQLAAAVRAQLAATQARIATRTERPRVLFLLGVGGGSPVAAGRGTAAAAMIEMAGASNVFGSFEGYKPVSGEAIAAADPQVVLTVEPGKDLAALTQRLLAVPGIAATSAGRKHRFVTMDGLRLLGFGPRLGDALQELAAHLHDHPPGAAP
ncbi:MAG: hemin ABC transporter substrate-binding protein [Thiotrichales bacterium]